jgi:hypothetical protein
VTKEEGMRRERDVALVTLYPLFSVTEITGSLKDTIHVFLKDYSDDKITHFALPRRKNEIKKAL